MTTHPPKTSHVVNEYTAEAELCGDLSSRPRTSEGPSMTIAYVPVVRKNGQAVSTVTLAMTYNRALRCAYIMATNLSKADPGSMVI